MVKIPQKKIPIFTCIFCFIFIKKNVALHYRSTLSSIHCLKLKWRWRMIIKTRAHRTPKKKNSINGKYRSTLPLDLTACLKLSLRLWVRNKNEVNTKYAECEYIDSMDGNGTIKSGENGKYACSWDEHTIAQAMLANARLCECVRENDIFINKRKYEFM